MLLIVAGAFAVLCLCICWRPVATLGFMIVSILCAVAVAWPWTLAVLYLASAALPRREP